MRNDGNGGDDGNPGDDRSGGDDEDGRVRTGVDRAQEIAYEQALDRTLRDPDVASRLGHRPGTLPENVRSAMLRPENVARVRRALRLDARRACEEAWRHCEEACEAWNRAQDRITRLRPRLSGGLPAAEAVLAAAAPIVLWAAGAGLWPAVAAFAGALAWLLCRPAARNRAGAALGLLAALVARAVQSRAVRRRTVDLAEAMTRDVMPAVVRSVVSELLGEDHDCLLIATRYEGIRDHRDRNYTVDNQAGAEIALKLDSLVDGTIAVCGPRGSGKTTLLETCAPGDLKVGVQAPASYAPLEFLTSLFVDLCETYMADHGARFPEFRRLSPLRSGLRRIGAAVRAGARSFLWNLLALGLFVLGVFAAARGFAEDLGGAFARAGDGAARHLRDAVTAVARGTRPWWALGAVVLAVVVHRYAGRWRLADVAHVARVTFLLPAGTLLVVLAPATLWSPHPVVAWFGDWRRDDPLLFHPTVAVVGALGFVAVWVAVTPFWEYFRDVTQRMALLVLVVGLGWTFLDDRPRQAALGWDLSERVVVVAVGVVLVRASRWTRGQREPALVRRCRDHLYRLQTVQSVSYGTSGAPTGGLLGLGSSYGTSFTASPLTLPELVQQLRRALADVAEELRPRRRRLVVTIDEIDRLGSTAEALEFLGEIKAILGVPGVHFLISVSEDVGASFVRRGLPGRDVADSTFDDVVHVRPCSLEESKAILHRRAEGFSEPFVALAHALAGGVPRDLIRFSREMVSLRTARGEVELRNVGAWLVVRAMRETVDAFRGGVKEGTLPTRSIDVVFGATRRLAELLHADCLCELGRMREQIGRFARWADGPGTAELAAELPSDVLERMEEAAAYAYFCVTLLDVFSAPGFGRRRTQAQVNRPNGSLERLAVVRAELSVSPPSARRLIEDTRAAWGLPEIPAPDLPEIVDAVRMTCRHYTE
ncbi:P-loop NTPase fold protein [Streptomyces sp. NPDC048481]|uniref:P-loop NTPase fold protein n=1 Tax=Streptomyces sp. NPDC048481 TaxID=3365557 RepID=UPI0037237687